MPRLALCGNVFRVDNAEDAVALMQDGNLPELRRRLLEMPSRDAVGASEQHRLAANEIGYGLYLPAQATAELKQSAPLKQRWLKSCQQSQWPIWTANAFPYGGFHAARVKEKAFLPDWSSPERLLYTCQAADLLAELMPVGSAGSISTCPLGYGPSLLESKAALSHLKAAEAHLTKLKQQRGVHLVLSLEPEPDGAFERVSALCKWLQQNFAESAFVGVCWDLCHGAVVGESPEEVVQALEQTGVRCGKVQISAALCLSSLADCNSEVPALLDKLAADPWFHQARGGLTGQPAEAWTDLPDFLQSDTYQRMVSGQAGEVGIHCHVPVHRKEYFPGLQGTDWRHAVAVALNAGIRDFELETYTLPVLPKTFLEQEGMLGTFVAELRACFLELGLDTTPRLS